MKQCLPVSLNDAWIFFSNPGNLALITPPQLGFKVLTVLGDAEIYEGMLIDYIVKPMFGIPVKWQTEICQVQRPFAFVDKQVKGPYKLWEHTHQFIQIQNGVQVLDEVKFEVPFGKAGDWINYLLINKKLHEIFKYRENKLIKIFKEHANNTH